MIARHFATNIANVRDRVAVFDGEQAYTYAHLQRLVARGLSRHHDLAGKRIGYTGSHPLAHLAMSIVGDWLNCHVFLAGTRSDLELTDLAERFGWDAIWRESDFLTTDPLNAELVSRPTGTGGVITILTSGTSGTPKAMIHSWKTLSSPSRVSENFDSAVWFSAYPLHLYAGLQVLLQAFLNQATLVVCTSCESHQVLHAMKQAGVTCASGTPTFWRQLLLFKVPDALRAVPLQQITTGGEVVTQELLDRMRSVFPEARISHIYATTELGRIFAIHSGREGFPASYLEASPEPGTELKILDGELHVRTRNRMIAYENQDGPSQRDWVATGDLVEVLGQRVYFRGRKSDIVNVGGNKVSPIQVEQKLGQVLGIAELRVYARKSSLMGQIVAMDIVLADGHDEQTVRERLKNAIRKLPSHEAPASINCVSAINVSNALKTLRRED